MITLNFDEVLKRIYNAKKGVEVRYGLGQGFEYCKQFADEAQGYANSAKTSEKKAADAVAGIEQTKTDAVQAVQNAQTTATTAVQQAQSTATTAVTTKQTEAVQAVDDERDAALQQVADSTQAAETAANAAGNSATAAGGSARSAESSATAASGSASAAATSESNAASSTQSAGTDADRAEAAAALAGTRANTDKTLKTENAPADAAAVGNMILDPDGNVIFYSKDAVDKLLAGKLSLSGGTMTGPLILTGGLTALGYADNAGNRNAMPPRDRSLGAPTMEHFETIASDKYNELFLGDYWTIDGVDWVIGDFKYWYNTGDTACTKPHVVAFPRNNLYTHKFNPTDTTEGGYVGSDLYKNGLTQAKQMVTAAFGSAHILNHREFLINAVTNGKPTGSDWYDSTIELMNENMDYGGRQYRPMPDGTEPWSTCRNYTIDKSQLSLFRYEPWMICNRSWFWLRDSVSASFFAGVSDTGAADCANASVLYSIRPVVGIC